MLKNKKAAKISDLKKGVEKIEKSQLTKEQKELRPGTVSTLKFIRTAFWIFMALILALGVWQLVKSKQPKIVENIMRYEFAESESDKAKAFAEGFTKAYLTYGKTIKDVDYKAKLEQYLNGIIMVGRPEYANGTSKVMDTMVYQVDKIDDRASNIIVRATVELTNYNKLAEKYDAQTGEKTTAPTVEEKVVFLSVPIVAEGGKVVVNDYPTFLSVDDKLQVDVETYSGDSTATDSEKQVIRKTLEDFFGVYYSGTAGQIKTFFKADPGIKGLQNAFTFGSIKSLDAYVNDGLYTVVVMVEITDNTLGGTFNQRHLLTLEKADDRYIIVTMKNRGK